MRARVNVDDGGQTTVSRSRDDSAESNVPETLSPAPSRGGTISTETFDCL